MFHVKLFAAGGEAAAVAALAFQVATEGPSATTVVIGLLAIVIGLQWQTGRKVAAIEERLKPLASREWTMRAIDAGRRKGNP